MKIQQLRPFDFARHLACMATPIDPALARDVLATVEAIRRDDDPVVAGAKFERLLTTFGVHDVLRTRPVAFALQFEYADERLVFSLLHPGAPLHRASTMYAEDAEYWHKIHSPEYRASEEAGQRAYRASKEAEECATRADAAAFNAVGGLSNYYADDAGVPYLVRAADDVHDLYAALAPPAVNATPGPIPGPAHDDLVLSALRQQSKAADAHGLPPAVRDYVLLWFAYCLGLGHYAAAELSVGEALNYEAVIGPQMSKYLCRIHEAGFSTDASAPLFPAASGDFLTRRTVRRIVQRAEQLAGLRAPTVERCYA